MANALYAETQNIKNADLVFGSDNTNGNIQLVPKQKIIDVRSDFVWSITPKRGVIQNIPAMYLVERSQQANSLVSSALYYITTFLNKTGIEGTESMLKGTSDKILTSIVSILNSSLGRFLGATGTATSSFETTIKELQQKIEKLIDNKEDTALLSTDTLKSYIGIYLTKKTGFHYVLPYFGNNYSITSSWAQQAQNETGIAKGFNTMMNAVAETAGTLNILQPGTFIEKPKYFQYPAEGESVNVSFPLLNTYNPSSNTLPYQQNYELLWILAYQNKPYRTSFSRIIPPKIYTLTVPGIKYMPYCYISNLSIGFQGTQRNLEVVLPTGQQIITPIPEAYEVSITFTSLLADIGNMMASKDFGFKINTSFR